MKKLALLVLCIVIFSLSRQLSAQDYRLRRFGPDNGKTSNANALNSSGAVAGTYPVIAPQVFHAFIWTRASGLQDLGTLGGTSSGAYALNDAGQVAGNSNLAGDAVGHAFRWTPDEGMVDLGTLSGDSSTSSAAFAINAVGQVIGISQLVRNGANHPFLWTPGKSMQDLGTLGGDFIPPSGPSPLGFAINDRGQVIGNSFLGDKVTQHAFLWDPQHGLKDLGTLPGGTGSHAFGINNEGEVIGESFTNSSGTLAHAFLWTRKAGMQDLGTLGGDSSEALFINSSGMIAGISTLSGQSSFSHAFVWTAAFGLQDVALPGNQACQALGLNNRGQMVGTCRAFFEWSNPTGIRSLHIAFLPYLSGLNDAGQLLSRVPAMLATPVMHVALASSQNPSNAGQPLTLSATISSVQGPPPDGELVQFKDSGKLLGTVPLVQGAASFTTSTLKTGTHRIRIFYPGDLNYDSAMSPILTQTIVP